MYVLNFAEEWGRALYEFADRLRNELGNDLIMIIGLGEDDLIYDSNVLVVVRNKKDEIIKRVAKIALEINSKYKCSINFYITNENDKNTIDSFLSYRMSRKDCEDSLKEFKEKLMKFPEILEVKEINGYDSNVLVIVKYKSDDIIRKIAKATLEVNSKYDCSINFYIISENEQGRYFNK
ncbi:MAG: hypothetical protein RQ952_04370 [Thermoproteota archaeon]|nr:hypothetical protein [Thermoproteota archaeon]